MSIRFILIIFISLILFGVKSHAQWIQCESPSGGFINCLSTKDSIIIAGTYDGSYISANNGNSWKPLKNGLPYFPDINSILIEDSFIMIGTWNYGIYKTKDNGKNWFPINNGLQSWFIKCLFQKGKNIFAGTGQALFVSADYGNSWNSASNGIKPNPCIVAMASYDSLIFAADQIQGFFYSNDTGKHWYPRNNGIPSYITTIIINGNVLYAGESDGMGGVYKSSDFGQNWIPINFGLPGLTTVYSLGILKDTIFAGTFNGIYKTSVDSINWKRLTNGINDTLVTSIAIIDTSIYIGTESGIYISENYGNNWKAINNGIYTSFINTLYSKGNDILVGTYFNGSFLSKDNGFNWIFLGNERKKIHTLSFLEKDSMILTGTYEGLYETKNNGISWVNLNDTLIIYSMVESGSTIIAGTNNGVSVSFDNGLSWKSISNGLPLNYVTEVSISGSNYFAISGDTAYISRNNGSDWEKLNINIQTDPDIRNLVVKDSIVVTKGVLRISLSKDAGVSWKNIGYIGTKYSALFLYNSIIMAYQDSNKLYMTSDFGDTWRDINSGLGSAVITNFAISGKYLYAGTEENGLWRRPLSELVGIDENNYNNILLIYPNPANDIINIKSTSLNIGEIEIINVEGQIINKYILSNKTIQINISNFQPDIYFIKFLDNKQAYYRKFIKL